ncbi:MAG TPA: TonB family protein [Steroidobacteraceae bacterium]
MSELWAKWEGQVIEGGFPLRRLIGVSDHSGVFLTESSAHNLPKAALKLVPAIPTLAESQLAYWNAAASLSHPRLLRLFAAGRCQLPAQAAGQGNLHFLYVLMEYADQNLAQLLESRALTEIEVRETLPPLLEGLAFLHSRNLVQGQLKPSNILVVGEQLKLASDTIRPAGEAATSISMVSVYDPPEGRDGSFSTAGDVWALGVTLYEALTRTTPVRPDERSHGVALPPDFPPASADVIRECLSRRPIDRPNVTALQAWVSGKVRYPGVRSSSVAADESGASSATSAAASGGNRAAPADNGGAASGGTGTGAGATAGSRAEITVDPAAPYAGETAAVSAAGARASPNQGRLTIRVERESIPEEPPPQRSPVPVVAAFSAVLAVLIIAWGAVRLIGHHSSASPPSAKDAPSANTTQPTPQLSDSQGPVAQGSQGLPPAAAAPSMSQQRTPPRSVRAPAATSGGATDTPTGSSAVVHEELPNVPHSALATIHGHVKVSVRVTVDPSGNVVDDSLEHAGPSQYFARVASKAARKWKFAPADQKSGRQWLVHFDFSRTGTTARATSAKS